ncbi:HlyD family type I secretion periplasmic adaptor subunit [Duganella sp. FT94W]|uniref:Membrane fusion protein (MFP) family protein n=1 Tax=Duganella lactea TaxID=2692173 RepID=A0ABW9V871_9BURK|nr:HlyD family type I secretion periplasmic adaptor subunit [Duganella lactea]MYM35553.1 HlyD family type I secretion periplasmic adaptor subunit [Duganella lactea]
MKAIENKVAAAEVISHDVEPLTVHTDATGYSRLGWVVVLVGFVGFMLWASFAPLDKGVPLSGIVAKESNRKAVQHQTGGIIDQILVKDGDLVKAGQVLVRMNAVSVGSSAEMTRGQLFTSLATESRLEAERDGKAKMAMPAELAEKKNDPRVQENMALQTQLFNSRRAALQNELAAVDESISGLKLQIKGLQESRDSKKVQLGLLKEQLDNMRELATEGYIPRSRMLDLERTYAQVNGAISEDIGNIGKAQSQVLELSLRRLQRTEEYQRDVRTQLSDVQKEAEALSARLRAQDFELANTEVKAPVHGTVVGLNVFTQGGVVQPGFRMMDIVPADDALVVEGQLAVNLIDKVHTGLPVELIFSAFNANKTPHIPGELIQVSADRSVDDHTGQPYYKVRARVTPAGAKLIASHKLQIQSGMPVEMFIKTGERTMMSYLLKPVFDRSKSSMAED